MGLKERLLELNLPVQFDQSVKRLTTVGVGGNAKIFCTPDSLYSLNTLLDIFSEYDTKYKIIGNGSNLLFSDQDYDGALISLKKIDDIFFKRSFVRVMAGASVASLIEFCINHGLGGVENLVGIPATVGGAVVMNAGAFGVNISKHIYGVETLYKGKIKKYFASDCKFGYRKSRFLSGNEVVVAVDFAFPKLEKEIFEVALKNYRDLRRANQPTGKTFGSVFKNPTGQSAGALLESVGLKGVSAGGASFSDKHANFIINQKNATANEIYSLIKLAKLAVKEKHGVLLKEEVEYVGNFNETNG